MSIRQLLLPRKPLALPLRGPLPRPHNHLSLPLRFSSTPHPPNPPSSKYSRHLNRLLSRLPKFLHPHTSALRSAPLSHVISFLILHEITAIVPLFGLAGLFHYMEWIPSFGGIVEAGKVGESVEKFGRYFGRKGWFGFSRVDPISDSSLESAESINNGQEGNTSQEGKVKGGDELVELTEKKYGVGERGGRILVEVATAYAITKVLLPVRIVVSVWGTPWFARVIVGRVWGVFGKKGVAGTAAGTGATAGGVVEKGVQGMRK